MRPYPTAAVIGAGSCGIAAAKALHERGGPFTVFEAMRRRYVASKRHTIRVDVDDHLLGVPRA